MNLENIIEARNFSQKKIALISHDLEKNLSNENITIITTGSYARGEANELSDIDFFVIVKNNESELLYDEKETILQIIKKYIAKDVGDTGTFGTEAVETFENLLTNIGGDKDDSAKFTRRMLFLLESKPLYNNELYTQAKNKLIERYIDKQITTEQLTRFLLNDFIRYYRTITTDFEYKVNEAGKSWGLRNIKLTYSRKILYFAGVLAVAQTYNKHQDDKIKTLQELLELTPIERIQNICNEKADDALNFYDKFLSKISQKKVRDELEQVSKDKREDNTKYRELKDKSKEFSQELQQILENTYNKKHPIHNALLF